MANEARAGNPHNNAFKAFIETLDFNDLETDSFSALEELEQLSGAIAFSNETNIDAFFNSNATHEMSELVRHSLEELGYRIDIWDDHGLGVYAGVLEDIDFMRGAVLLRQFSLPEDYTKPLRRPERKFQVESGIPGFDMYVISEYVAAFAKTDPALASELARLANEAIAGR